MQMVYQSTFESFLGEHLLRFQAKEFKHERLTDSQCIRVRVNSCLFQQRLGILAHSAADVEVSSYLAAKLLHRPTTLDAFSLIEESAQRILNRHDLPNVRKGQLAHKCFGISGEFIRRCRMNLEFVRRRRTNLLYGFIFKDLLGIMRRRRIILIKQR